MYITVADSDLQISGGGGGVLPIMADMGRFRGFRLKGVEEYGKSKGINNRCIL